MNLRFILGSPCAKAQIRTALGGVVDNRKGAPRSRAVSSSSGSGEEVAPAAGARQWGLGGVACMQRALAACTGPRACMPACAWAANGSMQVRALAPPLTLPSHPSAPTLRAPALTAAKEDAARRRAAVQGCPELSADLLEAVGGGVGVGGWCRGASRCLHRARCMVFVALS